jgi:hypothetical protein
MMASASDPNLPLNDCAAPRANPSLGGQACFGRSISAWPRSELFHGNDLLWDGSFSAMRAGRLDNPV